jgi:signal transduction histidine kinase/AraC-like DNA-binding protein
MLQSRLVVRQSCGCTSQSVAQAAAGSIQTHGESFAEAFDVIRATFLTAMAQIGLNADELAHWAGQLLTAFRSDLNGDSPGLFLHTVADVLDRVVASGGEVVNWQKTISALRRSVLPYLDLRQQAQAEDLFGQARVVIGEAAQRAQAYRQLQAERQAQALRDIGQALITTFDVDKLADVLAERLPGLGIVSCYLALYEDPAVSLEQSRLVLAYSERGRAPLASGGQLYPSHQLVPENLLPWHRRYSLVVEPLYFREEQIGFVLFEIGPRDGTIYEVLRAHISSALKGALLFHEAQRARLAAEKADQIKTRLLANVSHELRTPLNIILDTTKKALHAADGAPTPSAQNDLQHIQNSAEHQLRVINDLLDLSRAEIDELDLYLELINARPLLEEAFHSMADRATTPPDVIWQLQLPDRLPWINADAVRLRQILLNLLSNSGKFTEHGHITLGAEVLPPHLHVWVEDTGPGIDPDQQERIFEPFVTAEYDRGRQIGGIGLGLSITRHLVALHGGTMALDSQLGRGSTFHIFLPLPRLSDHITHGPEQAQPVLLLISTAAQPADEIIEFSQRQALDIRRLGVGDDLEMVLSSVQPAAVAWDLVGAQPGDWAIVRRLRNHPRLSQAPFVLYGQVPPSEEGGPELTMGLTSFVVKSTSGQALLDAINASRPAESAGPVLIVDDDPQARARYRELIAKGLPGHSIRAAVDGAAALTMMDDEIPSLVILDLMMPGLSGLDVLDRMRADLRLRQVPVAILSSKLLNLDDVKRLERHAHVTFQSKGILSEEETIAALNRALFGTDALPPQTSALVKRAVAYLHQNYTHPLSRWEIAEAIGVSEDYLTRVFSRELGLSPWDYLNRYRVNRAKELLSRTDVNIRSVAHQVGFRDQAYFSRVFHKLTGISPNEFRAHPEA